MTPAAKRTAASSARARRPRGTRENTRQELIEAAIRIIRERGTAAVTTVGVTQEAGLAQSGFYIHFRGVDECLLAAATEVATRIRSSIAEDRRKMQRESPDDAAAQVGHYRAVLKLFVEDRPLGEILLRRRHDPSPLGSVMNKLVAEIRQDLIDDLWKTGKSLGVADEHYARAELLATFIQANVLAAGEALLDGRARDRDLLAAELAASTAAMSIDLVRRCLDGTAGGDAVGGAVGGGEE